MADDVILNEESKTFKSQQKQKGITITQKISIACTFSLCFFIYRLAYQKYNGELCSVDKYHEFTYQANRKLYHGWDNPILGIGQLLMDGWVIFMSLYWVWNIKNMRFPMSAGAFFLFRAMLLNIQKLPFPEDIVWHNPGFISITVPYDHTRDFFYSGHTGTLVIISFELWALKRKFMCAVCIVSLLYMVNMLTITRIHYSIDIIGGIIFASFWFTIITSYLTKIDYGFSVPFYIIRKIYNKFKRDKHQQCGSQTKFNNKNFIQKNENLQNQEKQIQVNLDMNDQITDGNDFPYMIEAEQKINVLKK